MNNLTNALQHEGSSQSAGLTAILNLFQWMKENYPKLSAFSTSVLIKECLKEINSDEMKLSTS
jgi:hypothetical protein